jgi:virulence-associated protein VapD
VFAIAFDLTVKETARHHPKGVSAAYADIGATLAE